MSIAVFAHFSGSRRLGINASARTWFEGYGICARNDAVGNFVGDCRKTRGGVAARIAPGVNLGFSVDQSRTDIDVPLALQSAAIDLTQLGAHATVDKGPWTWAIAVVHGFGTRGPSALTSSGSRLDREGLWRHVVLQSKMLARSHH
jgi:uncharacterized protein with beta-barrel porin domain